MRTVNDPTPTVTVEELDGAKAAALFEQACQDNLGVDSATFLRAHDLRSYPADWSEQAIQRVEFLLPFVD